MTWHKTRLAILDTETTAPDPDTARLVTVAMGHVGDGPTDVTAFTVNPGIPIPAEATAVHGITDQQAQAEGCTLGDAVERIREFLTDTWAAGRPVIAYNAAYDLTVIDREFRRHHGTGLTIEGPVIDPYVIDREVDRYRRGSRTLTATAAHYRVRQGAAHDATQDALTAGRIAYAIAERHPKIAAMSLTELHAAQIGWHAARQDDFRAYLKRVGKPDDVSVHWPLRPAPPQE